ncbi:hypothetical protein [Geodermatophilus sabuli]|uniref:Uncharacterized protein n=1 Tax=Geodermatophilus sabuli TaxID=1564158 RepID=A0A285E9C6_9ACTN|nr:hypothetical protein [Geodermatophilus sabuli]MBB3084863.1 hypothetical protein [Geodermatophilus sabuli]SNX95729.1 hypothetical protein SAMN06893097_102433 [Geodermatophilus sabuli]
MPDYSEFPTTPTAWQEHAFGDVTPLAIEAPPPPPARRGVDLTALVPGLVFVVLAISLMFGAVFPFSLFDDGGLLWLVLIGAGVALLVSEVRKARRRRG